MNVGAPNRTAIDRCFDLLLAPQRLRQQARGELDRGHPGLLHDGHQGPLPDGDRSRRIQELSKTFHQIGRHLNGTREKVYGWIVLSSLADTSRDKWEERPRRPLGDSMRGMTNN